MTQATRLMNAPTKNPSLQAFRLALYRRALHPELFEIKGRRAIAHGDYEFEAWVMSGTHLLRFQHEGFCGTEYLTDTEVPTNDRGLVIDLPCAGEKDHEHQFSDAMNYMVTVQTETLPENLYQDTYDELVEFGTESDALMHLWEDPQGGLCASIVDTQRFRREVHSQAYHLFAQGGIVLRSQTLFEHS